MMKKEVILLLLNFSINIPSISYGRLPLFNSLQAI